LTKLEKVEKPGISIVIADNQPLTVAGLQAFLSERSDYHIIGQIRQASEFADSLKANKPDVLIADYNIPGFITIHDLEVLSKEFNGINILVISSDNDKASILRALQLGIKGYLTKECSKEEVLLAIQATAKGEKFFCHKILNIIMEKHFPSPGDGACDPTILTVRETEILKLIAKGRSTQQIADSLHLSPHTVQTHRKSIIRKLNIKSPTEFVIYAMDLGIITPR
jgi:two-component system, NarL family, invasion response regulator UvrY